VQPPLAPPIGLQLARTAKLCTRAFDDAMAAAGGSQPSWLILISLKTRPTRNQRELAEAIGIQGATLTHHLNAMEADGLLTRQRDPTNRRIHQVTLTPAGETLFHRLRQVAVDFDHRLRTGLSDHDITTLSTLLTHLRTNITP
jgi:MarR family transcriptional regulator for hemolysin